jgi:hypothetical protein
MAAGKWNFLIEQGVTFHRRIIYKSSTGTPIDLTGYTVKMEIRDVINGSAVLLLELSTANGKIVLTPAAGRMDITLTALETGAITWRSANFILDITDPSSVVTRLLRGGVQVDPAF